MHILGVEGGSYVKLHNYIKKEDVKNDQAQSECGGKKWDGLFPHNFKLKWNNMWSKRRSKKEARFIWAIWNKTIVVNVWRARVNISIDDHFCP